MAVLVKRTHEDARRTPTPIYEIIDSQSAKTISASDDRGFNGGENGKK